MPTKYGLDSINPLANFNIGFGTYGNIAILFIFGVIILGLIGSIFFFFYIKRKYWIQIKTFRIVGNSPQQVGEFSAREILMGMAGDKLWRVASKGINKISVIKWLPVGKKQSAPRTFWYWIREDGEWINFILSDIDAISRKAGVQFVQEDMRLQRLATDRLLEQRLMNKTFWDKWGNTIMTIIFFLVIAVSLVIIFYQVGKLVDRMVPLVTSLKDALDIVRYTCGLQNNGTQIIQTGGGSGLVPVSA